MLLLNIQTTFSHCDTLQQTNANCNVIKLSLCIFRKQCFSAVGLFMLQFVQITCTISIQSYCVLTQTLGQALITQFYPLSSGKLRELVRQSVLKYHIYTSCLHSITFFILEHNLHYIFEKEIQLSDYN